MTIPIKFRRGLKTNLPSTASAGEPLFTTDTHELFIGTGDGLASIGTDSSLVERVDNLEKYRSYVTKTYTETFASPKVDREKTTAWYSLSGIRTSKVPGITENFRDVTTIDQAKSYGVTFDVNNGLVKLSNTLEGAMLSTSIPVMEVDKVTMQSDHILPSALGAVSTRKITGDNVITQLHLEPTILVDRLNRMWVISFISRGGIYAVVTNPDDTLAFSGYLYTYGTGQYAATTLINAVVDYYNNIWIALGITNTPELVISITPDFKIFLNPISVRGNVNINSSPPFLKLHTDKNNRVWYAWSASSTFYYGCFNPDGTFFIPTTAQTFNPSASPDNVTIVEDRTKGYICFIIHSTANNVIALRINYDGTNPTAFMNIGKSLNKWLGAVHDEATGITTILGVENNAPLVHRLNLSTGTSSTSRLDGFMAIDHSLPIGFVLQDTTMRVFYHQMNVGSTRLISIDLASLSVIEPDTLIQSGTNTTRASGCLDGYGKLNIMIDTTEYASSTNYKQVKLFRYDTVPTSIEFQVSPDGTSWFPVSLGQELSLSSKTNSLYVKTIMRSPNTGVSPILRSYSLILGGAAGEITQVYTSSTLPSVTPISFVTLTANQSLYGGDISWEVSNNGGLTWQSADLGQQITFSNPINSDLRVRATLYSPASEKSTLSIHNFTVISSTILLNPDITDPNLPQRVIDLENNLIKTNFKLITYMNAPKYGLKNVIVDTFTDLSGVDIAKSQVVYDHELKKFTTGIVDIVPLMTANNAPAPFVAAADRVTYGAAFMLFDRSTATYWGSTSNDPHWISIYLGGAEQTIDRYLLSGVSKYAPTNWLLQGSNNGSDWETLHSVSGYVWTNYENNQFTIPTPNIKPYKYYRIYITASQYGLGVTQISELRLQKAVDQNFLQSKPEITTAPPNKIVIVGDEVVAGGKIEYHASRDGGNTWTVVPAETLIDISSQPVGTELVVKATIHGNAELNAWGYYYE